LSIETRTGTRCCCCMAAGSRPSGDAPRCCGGSRRPALIASGGETICAVLDLCPAAEDAVGDQAQDHGRVASRVGRLEAPGWWRCPASLAVDPTGRRGRQSRLDLWVLCTARWLRLTNSRASGLLGLCCRRAQTGRVRGWWPTWAQGGAAPDGPGVSTRPVGNLVAGPVVLPLSSDSASDAAEDQAGDVADGCPDP
jgi:hypothetical protein